MTAPAAGKRFADRLAGGPSRGLGCTNAIATEVLHHPELLTELVAALKDKRPIVLIRTASALKKVQAAQPDLLKTYAKKILSAALTCEELQARWNLTIVVGNLTLTGADRALAIELMFEALRSESGFLRTFALQGLANFAQHDPALQHRVRPIAEDFIANGTGAMKTRARRLLPK